jgi:protocatechuate 3,4-dioxygenase beta subunit
MDKHRLAEIEQCVLRLFQREHANRLLSKTIFDGMPEYANADIVRAFEDLEKKLRLVVRYTAEGEDWIQLTQEGARIAGLAESQDAGQPHAIPHPPKSST